MYIRTRYSGYNRHGEQSAAGQFLILMQPDTGSANYRHFKPQCGECGKTRKEHIASQVTPCPVHGVIGRLDRLCKAGQITVEDRDAIWNEKFDPACPECRERETYLKGSGCIQFRQVAESHPIRAIVRYVRMRQLGHFMMGSARIGKTRLSLSGSYGSDGLPVSVPDEVYELGTVLPQELYDAWNNGGGWNGAGSEAPAMRQWAIENLIHKK